MGDKWRESKTCNNWDQDEGDIKPTYSDKIRFLVITLGATGSGKSSMARELKKYAKKINASGWRAEWQEKVLDDYVEESPLYKQEMDKVINKLRINISADLSQALNKLDGCNIYNEPWYSFAQGCTNTYFKVRRDTGAVDKFNTTFHTSIQQGKNIIFEITGRNILTTIEALNAITKYTNDCEKFNYIVLAGYNITDFYSLQNRNIGRFVNAFKSYNENPRDNNPPRLPWVGCFNPDNNGLSFCKALSDIKENIISVIENCSYYSKGGNLIKFDATKNCMYNKVNTFLDDKRPDHHGNGMAIDLLFVFNNIYRNIKLIAKIPISMRSKHLVNFQLTPNVYPTKSNIENLIRLIDTYGPLKEDGKFIDVCGEGLPVLSSHENKLKPQNIVQENFSPAHDDRGAESKQGGGKKRKKRKKKSRRKNKKKTRRKKKSRRKKRKTKREKKYRKKNI